MTTLPTLEEIALEITKNLPARILSASIEYPRYISLHIGLNDEGFTQEIAIGLVDNSYLWNSNSCGFDIVGEVSFNGEGVAELTKNLIYDIESAMVKNDEHLNYPECADSCAGICGACGQFYFLLHECDIDMEETLND